MKKFLLLAFLALLVVPAKAQTPITVQNSSFGLSPIMCTTNANGCYNSGPIQGWALTGNGGLWQPAAHEYAAIPVGTTVAYSNSGIITQDLGAQQAGVYGLVVEQGNRGDGIGTSASCTVSLGTSSITTPNSNIPVGAWQLITLAYSAPTNPTGDLIISLSGSGSQCNFNNVIVTFTAQTTLPNVTLAINSGSTAVYDDGTAILLGTAVIVSQSINSTTTTQSGTIVSDSNGNLSGSLTINPNWVDANGNITLSYGLPIVPNVLFQSWPVGQFQHSSTGLTINLVLFKQGALGIKSQTLAVTP